MLYGKELSIKNWIQYEEKSPAGFFVLYDILIMFTRCNGKY